MTAAIAISNDLPLFTRNPSDFDANDGIDLRAISHPDNS
jgi:predicted nucleic acid-binding protein